jgi:hypothetical protein
MNPNSWGRRRPISRAPSLVLADVSRKSPLIFCVYLRKGCAMVVGRFFCCVAPNQGQCDVACTSREQIAHIDEALCHINELEPLVHRRLTQARIRVFFAQAVAADQQALGSIDQLAV